MEDTAVKLDKTLSHRWYPDQAYRRLSPDVVVAPGRRR
jgi:hypothetical protein